MNKAELVLALKEALVELGAVQPNNRLRLSDLIKRYGKSKSTLLRWVGDRLPNPNYDAAGMYWKKEDIEDLDLQYQMSNGYFRPRIVQSVPGDGKAKPGKDR